MRRDDPALRDRLGCQTLRAGGWLFAGITALSGAWAFRAGAPTVPVGFALTQAAAAILMWLAHALICPRHDDRS